MIRPRHAPDARAVARHYDELDPFYRALWGENLHHGLWLRGDEEPGEAAENLTRLVAERGRIGAGDLVCDVGCGYGASARFLADRYGARVVGISISTAQLERAAERADPEGRVRFLLGDWLSNPFASGRFGVVVAIECASHMTDKPAFLRECRRVLRTGGRLVVAAWLAAERPSSWERRHLLEPICAEGRLAGLATRSEYERWMERAGLQVVDFRDLSRSVRRTWSVGVRRLSTGMLRRSDVRRYLTDSRRAERGFAVAVPRIWLAYRTGALRYGVFTGKVA